MSKNTVLEINNVSKSFGKTKIIKNINLEVNFGEVFGFLGPNGAGKTTTIKMIVGLLSIEEGSIKINGYDVAKNFENAMRNIGAIVESPDMYEYMSGIDNLKLYARIHNIDRKRIDEVVELVGLKNRIKDKVKKYSLGMKQRIGLAQTLLHNPKVLILDEPTNGLDPAGIRELRDILKKMAHEQGICVFVSSHLLSEMQLMCDRIAVINNGEIIKVETIQDALNIKSEDNEVKSKYEFSLNKIEGLAKSLDDTKYTYEINAEKNIVVIHIEKEQVNEIIKLIIDNGLLIYEILKQKQSLEEAFLDITTGGGKNA